MAAQPYYEHGGVTLYHGDCREVLPRILPLAEPLSLVLTDPPWELAKGCRKIIVQGNDRALSLWREVVPLFDGFAKRVVVWLPSHADPREWLAPIRLPFLRTLMLRRPIPGYYGRILLDVEMMFALGVWPQSQKGRRVIPGGLQVRRDSGPFLGHPTQRPLEACRWLVRF